MPRLRRLKRELLYEELFPTDTWPKRGLEEDTSNESIETSNQTGEFSLSDAAVEDFEPAGPGDNQPRGWYSNDAIIATMPDQKLREAYQRYKTLARVCLEEITQRAASGRCVRATEEFDVVCGMHRFVPVGRTYRNTQSARTRARSTKQLALTPEQMLNALSMLLKLKQQGQP